ncbi:MAG: tetratricopeptide repeat protein [bacterium]|nr:tetratricopeptide repeat protein [bacterium]
MFLFIKNKLVLVIISILLVGILLRFLYLIEFQASPLFCFALGPDVSEYNNWAMKILSGKYLWSRIHIHAPLYSYFLALLYKVFSFNYFQIRFFQEILGLISCIPIIFLLRKINASKFTIILTALLWCWYPPLIYYTGELISEILVIPLICISLYFIYKFENNIKNSGNLFLGGFFIGLANITHPITLFFSFAELLYFLIRLIKKYNKYKLKNFILFALGIVIPIICIIGYNSYLTKQLSSIQANSGFNFYLGNNINSNGICYLRPGKQWNSVHDRATLYSSKDNITKNKYFINKSLNFIKNHTSKWIILLLKKASYTWNYIDIKSGSDTIKIKYYTKYMYYQKWAFFILVPFALASLFLSIFNKKYRYKYRHLFLLLISYWLAQILFVSSGRYRIPMIISIIPLAASYYFLLIRFKKKLLLIMLLLAAFLISIIPGPSIDIQEDNSETYTLYAEAFLLKKQFNNSINYLLKAIKYNDNQLDRNYDMLGYIYSKKNNIKKSLYYFKKALLIDKNNPLTLSNLANVYAKLDNKNEEKYYYNRSIKNIRNTTLDKAAIVYYNFALYQSNLGNINQAEKYYLLSLKYRPYNSQTLNNLGIILVNKKKYKKAVYYFKKAVYFKENDYKYLINIAYAELCLGNRQIAKNYINKAVKLYPKLIHTQIYKKILLYSENNFD